MNTPVNTKLFFIHFKHSSCHFIKLFIYQICYTQFVLNELRAQYVYIYIYVFPQVII